MAGSGVEMREESEVDGGASSVAGLWDWGFITGFLVDLQERPGDFLRTEGAFRLSGLGLMGGLRAGLSLSGTEVEGEEGSDVVNGASSV